MMFAGDQIALIAQARRILAGHWDVVGPDAAGLNIIGPLYSFLLAGLLWIWNDPGCLALFGAGCEILGAWFVYDTGRRVAGRTAGIVAALTYALAPVLVLSTRLIWNPSLLPFVLTVGWWLVARRCQRPSTTNLVGIALIAGLNPALHATGVFYSVAFLLAAFVVTLPSPRQLVAVGVAGLLPLTPILARMVGDPSGVGGLGERIAVMDVLPTLQGVAHLTLGFPTSTLGGNPVAELSTAVIHVQAAVALSGLVVGLTRRSAFWPLWLGIVVSSALNVGGAIFYTQVIAWFYFIGLTPGVCLGVARAIGVLHRFRLQASLAMVALASSHLAFVHQFDRPAITSGFIELRAAKLAFRGPETPGVQLYFPTLRALRIVGSALADVVPDGATAMMVVHGARAEVWRETGAELLPMAAAPRERWGSEFVVMGPGATTLAPDARLLDGRVCMFARPTVSWRVQHLMKTGWELPELSDADWTPLDLPRRVAKPSLGGHNHAVSVWRAPLVGVRGEFLIEGPSRRRAFVVTIHSPVNSAHWIAKAFVNGVPMTPDKGRLIYTPFSRNEEWLLDATEHTRPGRNVIALAIDGQTPLFDLDVFELPCLDAEWYH